MSTIDVFIENEAGSDVKHHYDEEHLTLLRIERLPAAYPFPYGFVPGTLAPDGDAADCFVLTARRLSSGEVVSCEPVALQEQTEGGAVDHNVLAVLPGEPVPDLEAVAALIARFGEEGFAGMPGRETVAGRLLGAAEALEYLARCTDAHAAR